jgi:hypothetical protein
MERLLREDMKMLDYSSLIHPDPSHDDTLDSFRGKIEELERQASPKYLLIIWPGIISDGDPDSVLSALKGLAHRGCRIAALNEFPTKGLSDPAFAGKLFLIQANAEKGFELLCGHIKEQMTNGSRVLLVHASQQFQSAQRRRELYKYYLDKCPLDHDPLITNSWDYDESRVSSPPYPTTYTRTGPTSSVRVTTRTIRWECSSCGLSGI